MKRLLIANRGEIALRIARACREASIEVVAAHSRVDENLRHLRLSDDTVCIGQSSYLDVDQLLAAAITRGCDAIHPGYGFLSENSEFAEKAEATGLTFIGPTPEQIRLMGNKSEARRILSDRGVPTLPGSEELTNDLEKVQSFAVQVGYPLLLKASHGGGGRGIKLVEDDSQLAGALAETSQQAENLFGQSEVYLEKYLADARHVEIQIAGDGNGHVISLGARDCSIQRQNQKLIEEAPPPGIEPSRLIELGETCCKALADLNYRNLGTLEFLYRDGEFYFIEMNTRLQVEHPVTEAVTGLDLVAMQLHIAEAGELPLHQSMVQQQGHAIECRINAEDDQFRPSPGLVTDLQWPGGPGIRLDSHLYAGYKIPHQYDSLIGKLIAHGHDRDSAIARMSRALTEMKIRPIASNLGMQKKIIDHEVFQAGGVTTSFLTGVEL